MSTKITSSAQTEKKRFLPAYKVSPTPGSARRTQIHRKWFHYSNEVTPGGRWADPNTVLEQTNTNRTKGWMGNCAEILICSQIKKTNTTPRYFKIQKQLLDSLWLGKHPLLAWWENAFHLFITASNISFLSFGGCENQNVHSDNNDKQYSVPVGAFSSIRHVVKPLCSLQSSSPG